MEAIRYSVVYGLREARIAPRRPFELRRKLFCDSRREKCGG